MELLAWGTVVWKDLLAELWQIQGASFPCLGELTLCVDVTFTLTDSRLFAWSELEVWICRQNANISYSNDFMQGLSANVDVSA